jgi:hypothetical protein
MKEAQGWNSLAKVLIVPLDLARAPPWNCLLFSSSSSLRIF